MPEHRAISKIWVPSAIAPRTKDQKSIEMIRGKSGRSGTDVGGWGAKSLYISTINLNIAVAILHKQ